MKKAFILPLLLLFQLQAMAGGGWTLPKKGYFFKLGQQFTYATRFYGPNSESDPITTFKLFNTSVYGEYGITNRLNVIGYVPLAVGSFLNKEVSANTGLVTSPGDSYTSIGDLDIGLKYGIWTKGRIKVAGSLLLGIPTGQTGKGDTGLLQTGDGEFNQLFGLDFSTSTGAFFHTLSLGFNNRTQGFSEEVRFGYEVGWKGEKWIVISKFRGIQSLLNGTSTEGGGSIFSNNLEYNMVSLEVARMLTKKLGVSAEGAMPLSGRSVLNAPMFGVGVFLTTN